MPLGVLGGEVIYSLARDERRLALMVAALDRLLDQCGETVRGTDVCLRRWLRGRFPDRPNKAPFELVTKSSSEKVYRKELKRFVCFWLRLFRLLPVVTREVTGRGLNKHQFRALRELWVDDIWRSEGPVDADTGDSKDEGQNGEEDEDEDEDEDESEDEDEDENGENEDEGNDEDEGEQQDETEDGGQRSVAADAGDQFDAETTSTWSLDSQEHHPQDPAADILLRFCYFAITKDFEGGVASSTMLVYFSVVRGLSTLDGDEYLQPHRFTPILARLIYCSRLIFLEAVLPRFSRSYGGIARRPRHGLLRRLNAARREYMCDGILSPIGEFLSLLSYGNALRRSQGSTFRFHWSDDGEVLSWDGNQQLSMSNFRGLAREVLRSAMASCSRLMYDREPAHADLSQIRDRLSMTTPGYSFVSDPANKLTDAHLKLLLRACVSPIDGLLRAQGKDQSTWDIRAARSYLEAHDDFLRVLMVLCNIDGGQYLMIPLGRRGMKWLMRGRVDTGPCNGIQPTVSTAPTQTIFNPHCSKPIAGFQQAGMPSCGKKVAELAISLWGPSPANWNVQTASDSIAPSQKRPFMSDPAESPLGHKRLRLGIDSLSASGPVAAGVVTRSTSEDLLAVRVDEDSISPTCDDISSSPPERQTDEAESAHDNTPPTIGPFVHLIQLNLVICVDCKTACLSQAGEGTSSRSPSSPAFYTGATPGYQ
ncbi:hypothetical protein FOMG_17377 [Fusarium oxysporum f. sp. melonis 26406]|uniref:Uncharacterized protein n=1 Tax=Fusarium oxysporum f. sp. melonis 26406 TaxID=1089452 RepID=W9ZY85_FUSOX|nr:hypothetical protein FOMG_17377 [Fusarium oxysporum f. sp. melonis 26406]